MSIHTLKEKQRAMRDEYLAIKVLADTPANQKRIRDLEKRGRRLKITIEKLEGKRQTRLV